MSISMYEASVGVFVPFLRNLSGFMDQAARHAEAKRIDSSILLGMRLYPNMYNLAQQVTEANRHAVIAGALLAGCEPEVPADIPPDLPGLKSRIAAAIAFVESLPRGEIDAAAEREVTFRFRSGAERKFSGRSLLLGLSVPQFFFHVTTAYDILRHAGVELAKKDFLGPPRPA